MLLVQSPQPVVIYVKEYHSYGMKFSNVFCYVKLFYLNYDALLADNRINVIYNPSLQLMTSKSLSIIDTLFNYKIIFLHKSIVTILILNRFSEGKMSYVNDIYVDPIMKI